MVTLIITSLAIVVIFVIGLYFWQKSAPNNSENVLPPPPDARSLFAGNDFSAEEETEQAELQAEDLTTSVYIGESLDLDELVSEQVLLALSHSVCSS